MAQETPNTERIYFQEMRPDAVFLIRTCHNPNVLKTMGKYLFPLSQGLLIKQPDLEAFHPWISIEFIVNADVSSEYIVEVDPDCPIHGDSDGGWQDV